MTTTRLAACVLSAGVAVVSVCAASFDTQVSGPPAAGPVQASGTAFFDGFDGSAIDRNRWAVIVTGRTVNNEQQAYVDSAENIYIVHGGDAEGADGGALVIQPRAHPGFVTPEGRRFDFTSGRLDGRDKYHFTYGVVSARIKLTAGDGLWPAFWTLGPGRWPETGEMDIMENVGARDWFGVALHGPGYSGNTPFGKRRTFAVGTDITGWHVYTMRWQSTSIAFMVDDEEFYRVTPDMVTPRGPWAYDTEKFLILNVALGGNYPQAVNHAATPYPGLPESTVELIGSGRAKMLVDWVRVAGN